MKPGELLVIANVWLVGSLVAHSGYMLIVGFSWLCFALILLVFRK